MSTISKKICLIGDFNVGKTSLIRRFVENKFSDRYLTTIGVKISRKSVVIEPNRQQVNLLIWDIEGETKEKEIPESYLQGANGAIIVGDLSRVETINHIEQHAAKFIKLNPASKIIIALNKSDLIAPEKVEKLVKVSNFLEYDQVMQTLAASAITGESVEIIFERLAKNIVL